MPKRTTIEPALLCALAALARQQLPPTLARLPQLATLFCQGKLTDRRRAPQSRLNAEQCEQGLASLAASGLVASSATSLEPTWQLTGNGRARAEQELTSHPGQERLAGYLPAWCPDRLDLYATVRADLARLCRASDRPAASGAQALAGYAHELATSLGAPQQAEARQHRLAIARIILAGEQLLPRS